METELEVEVFRGQGGRVSEIHFSHHPAAAGIKKVMEKAVRGDERTSGIAISDGIIVFSYDGCNVAAAGEHQALVEMHRHIIDGSACLLPLQDSFLDGIVIAVC